MATAVPNPSAAKQVRPRRLSLRFMIIGAVIVWSTTVAPIITLLSWFVGLPTGRWLLASMVLAPFAVVGLWRVIQRGNPRLRWPVMQYFGWGAVLLPLVLVGAVLTLWLPERTVALIVLAAWLVLGSAGVFAATNIRERHLAFDHETLDRTYKLVQLSDVHVGSRSASFLAQAIDQARRHDPDLLLITGDLLDTSAVQTEDLTALADMSCPVFLSLGNHERYIDLDAAIAMIEAHGIQILRSQSAVHECLQIIGIDDADHKDHVENELPKITHSSEHYRILLYHRPDGWSAAREAGIDLMLAGHTHAGQIWPFNLLVKWRFPEMVGLFSEDDRHLYVSPGTGCWGPIMRLGTRAEMTVIDLSPRARSRTT